MTVKFVISKESKSYQTEKELMISGKKIGEEFDGSLIGLEGYTLQITGGSDKNGFPMIQNIEGTIVKRYLIKEGKGFSGYKKVKKKKFKIAGIRKRKSLRGNTIDDDISQINCKVMKEGNEKLEDILGKSEEPKESKEEPKKEVKEPKKGSKETKEEPKKEEAKKDEQESKPVDKG